MSMYKENDNAEYNEGKDDPQYEFVHRLYNTVLLLGGEKRIADLVTKLKDNAITLGDADELRNYNCDLISLAKNRLAYLSTMKIQVQ